MPDRAHMEDEHADSWVLAMAMDSASCGHRLGMLLVVWDPAQAERIATTVFRARSRGGHAPWVPHAVLAVGPISAVCTVAALYKFLSSGHPQRLRGMPLGEVFRLPVAPGAGDCCFRAGVVSPG